MILQRDHDRDVAQKETVCEYLFEKKLVGERLMLNIDELWPVKEKAIPNQANAV